LFVQDLHKYGIKFNVFRSKQELEAWTKVGQDAENTASYTYLAKILSDSKLLTRK